MLAKSRRQVHRIQADSFPHDSLSRVPELEKLRLGKPTKSPNGHQRIGGPGTLIRDNGLKEIAPDSGSAMLLASRGGLP